MSIWLILAIAGFTYGSRALAVVAMPDPSPRLKRVLDRIPAPLFAALAAISLFDSGRLVDSRTLGATLGALALSPSRSLLFVLFGGVAGYAVASAVW